MKNEFIEIEIDSSKQIVLWDYLNRKKFRISQNLAELILKYFRTNNIEKFENREIKCLKELGIHLEETQKNKELINLKRKWEKYGWKEAAKYHISTLDYPFRGKRDLGLDIMIKYNSEEEDNFRGKNYPETALEYHLDDIDENLLEVEGMNKSKLFLTLKYAFCYSNFVDAKWTSTKIFQRTTPSGGSRQPTEGYVFVNGIENVQTGLYYINGEKKTLQCIKYGLDISNNYKKLFPVYFSNRDGKIGAVVILTSIFEKNMYRYREARTFRSIHMDVGHITGLIEGFGKQYKFNTFVHYATDEKFIESELGVHHLEEGYQTAILIEE
ncbi:SagB/ThcOx family dehydrogenase [Streptococcus suis]|uniref:SagB/ThcOx family dehydrogenase n=1 Tax=Streptococcus suis TaxID=1307 RepID=UPI00209B1378|nr:SagB/ThcOx family dehydrogenase [Streptococcus suis]MCO8214236.1 SagB/ThcOx family dehydrogenase [Streptococcus suis]HEM3439605.1 SagB/ThcOx family dehydrogenase [Streptococcus suis]